MPWLTAHPGLGEGMGVEQGTASPSAKPGLPLPDTEIPRCFKVWNTQVSDKQYTQLLATEQYLALQNYL